MDNDDRGDLSFAPLSSRSGSRTPQRTRKQSPQETVKQFWDQFSTKFPGKVYTVLPDNPYARSKAARIPKGAIQGQNAAKPYDQARSECERAVNRIVRECERLNQKYTDPHFDIEVDLKSGWRDYLDGLDVCNLQMLPKDVKRVTEIFENPQFYVNGPTASDVRQGRDGDCWLMAALCTLGNKKSLIDNICVARNEKVGVYGFVFFRDGEWQQCIVDDKLYLRAADYDESIDERQVWDDITRKDTEEEYRKAFQTGSRALYFAQCADENEIWLPLLEKAFAKAHGDYSAIEGGFVGEAIEDLTGGVTIDILSSSILDKDRFWKEELMKVNQDFLFGCGTGFWSNWLCPKYQDRPRNRNGIFENHSYSIMEAREIDGHRLLRLRNPWGKKEWSGAWSDGSEQWTPEWMEKLGHKFGNDGVFWISYEDLLKKYQHFERTRLFGREWAVTQQWTTLSVPWSADYHSTKFMITVTEESPLVIVLSQLDPRYFKGLAGQYDFALKFRVQKDGQEDYLVRSQTSHLLKRSANAEITLKPGHYCVLMKITAYRNPGVESTEKAVSRLASTRREKLVQIGLSYDLAHAKGHVIETQREKKAREEYERRCRALNRNRRREETKKKLQKEWIRERKLAARKKRATGRLSGRKDSLSSSQSLGNGVFRKGSLEDSVVNSPATFGINGTIPTVQLNDYNKLKRKSDPRHLSIDTNFTADGFNSSDLELLDGFEFDSDIDMSEEPEPAKQAHRELSIYSLEESISDPWNAVCVVGLRVYSKDQKLSLEVVRPVPEDDVEAALDMDDPAVSATNERGGWDQFPS